MPRNRLASHDEFHRMIKGAPSPLKASKKAAEHMVHSARRVPLSHLLDRLESGLESVTLGRSHSSPTKFRAPKRQAAVKSLLAAWQPPRPATAAAGCAGTAGAAGSAEVAAATAMPAVPPPPPLNLAAAIATWPQHEAPTAAAAAAQQQRAAARANNFHSSRKEVVELYDNYVTRREVRESKAKLEAREHAKDACEMRRRAQSQPDPGCFADVLKLHYPYFSVETIELMIRDAREGIEAIDRRCFIVAAKGTYAERLQLAFNRADKDGSGELSVDEFILAIQSTGANPPGRSASHPMTERDLKALFRDADTNGDGVLSLDEFLEFCARETWIVKAFDRIVENGVKRKLKAEEARLTTIFRHPVSPLSRCIKTPNGSKFRPGLWDLRRMDEVGCAIKRENSE